MADTLQNKNSDWIGSIVKNPETTMDQWIYEEGLNANNTTIYDKEFYKSKDTIKKMFTDSSGKFKEKEFDNFYNQSVASYNELMQRTYNEDLEVSRSFLDNELHVPKDAKKISSKGKFTKVMNPEGDLTSFEGFNVTTKGKKSKYELAQNNEVLDYATGESKGWKPNDDDRSGILDFIFKTEPVVFAQYDEDGFHSDPITGKQIPHSKGQPKLNSDGNFYYETLGNRESTGKTFLSIGDTVTDDGSFANKFDFIDSDGLDKSITGSVVKNAAKIAPYFIPYVKNVYTIANTVLDLANATPELVKAMASMTGTDLSNSKTLNQLKGQTARLYTGTSEYAKQNTFGVENVLNMVSQTFDQLNSQRAIASIPSLLGSKANSIRKYENLIKKTLGEEGFAQFGVLDKSQKMSTINKLSSYNATIKALQKRQEFWQTTGAKALSSLYMAATSATSAYEDAKSSGLSTEHASAYYMGVLASYYGLMQYTDIGHWALKGIGVDDASKALNKMVKTESETMTQSLSKLMKAYETVGQTEAVKSSMFIRAFNAGKEALKNGSKKLFSGEIDTTVKAMAAEGLEEVSEEAMQDGWKSVYNTLNQMGYIPDATREKKFQFDMQDIVSRYGMSLFGGALGGAVFHLNDKFINKTGFSDDKDMLWYISNGHKDKVIESINKLESKGFFGSKALTPNAIYAPASEEDVPVYEPTNDPNKSQNSYIANLLKAKVNQLSTIVDYYNIPSEIKLGKDYTKMVNGLINVGVNSSISDDIYEISSDLFDDIKDLRGLEKPLDTATDEEISIYKNKQSELKKKIDEKKKELVEISEGKKLEKYFGEAYFSTRAGMYAPFGVKTVNDFAESKFNKKYKDLTDEEKVQVEKANLEYKEFSRRNQLRISKGIFDNYVDHFIKNSAKLKQPKIIDVDRSKLDNYIKELSINDKLKDKTFEEIIDDYDQLLNSEITNVNQTPIKYEAKLLQDDIEKDLSPLKDNTEVKDSLKNVINSFLSTIVDSPASYTTSDVENISNAISPISLIEGVNPELDKSQVSSILTKPLNNYTIEDYDALIAAGLSNDKAEKLKYIIENKDLIKDSFNTIIGKQLLSAKTPSTVLSVLKDLSQTIAESDELDDTFDVFSILEDLDSKTNKQSFNISEFVINTQTEEDKIKKAIQVLDRAATTINALTIYDNNNRATYGDALNSVLKDNKLDSKYDGNLFSQEESSNILKELEYHRSKLTFALEVSKQNKGNKVRYDKIASLNFKARNIYSLFDNGEDNRWMHDQYFDGLYEGKNDFFEDDSIKDYIDFIRLSMGGFDSEQITTNAYMLNLSDEDAIKFEEAIMHIEQYIYDKVNESEDTKKKFGENLKTITGDKVSFSSLYQSNDKQQVKFDPKVTNYGMLDTLNHMLVTVSYSPKKLNSLFIGSTVDGKTDFENSKYAPLQSQETAMRYALASILSNVNGYNIIADVYNQLYADVYNKDSDDQNKAIRLAYAFQNLVQLTGYPGTGKSTILDTISRCLENAGVKIGAYAPSVDQGSNLIGILGERDNLVNKAENSTIDDLMGKVIGEELYNKMYKEVESKEWSVYDMTNNKSFPEGKEDSPLINFVSNKPDYYPGGIFKLNEQHPLILKWIENIKPIDEDVIVIDEYTHVSPVVLAVLELYQRVYNSKFDKKISLLFTGDMYQDGYLVDANKTGESYKTYVGDIYSLKSPELTDVIRSGYNNKTDNIIKTHALLNTMMDTPSKSYDILKNNEMYYSYFENDKELIGDKITESVSKSDLEKLAKDSTGKVGVVVSSMDSKVVKTINSLPEAIKSKFDIRIESKVQGKEYEYVIVDVDLEKIQPGDYSSLFYLRKMYTYMSRSKKGSIITNGSINQPATFISNKNTDNSKAQFNSDQIEKYKEFRFKILNLLTDKDFQKEIKPSSAKEYKQDDGSGYKEPEEWTDDKVLALYEMSIDEEDKSPYDTSDSKETSKKPSEFTQDMLFMYPFHERATASFDEDDGLYYHVIDADESALMDRFGLEGVPEKAYKEILSDLKLLKNSILSAGLYHPDKSLDEVIPEHILKKYNIKDTEITLKIESNIDYEKDPEIAIDMSPVTNGDYDAEKNLVKIAHFLVATIDGIDITLAALPNINNPNVAIQPNISRLINDLNKINVIDEKGNKTTKMVDGTYYRTIKTDNPLGLIKKLTRHKFVKREKPVNLKQFRAENPELIVSKTYISTREINFDETDENLELKNKKRSYNGKPLVFVSFDPTLSPGELKDEYLRQLQHKLDDPEYSMSVGIMFVSPKKVKFSNWLLENHNRIKAFRNKEQIDPSNVAYENHFLAARLITNIISNTIYYKNLLDRGVDKLSSAKQKEAYKKFFDTGDQSTNELATGLINTLKIRIDGLFDWNELTAAYKSAVEAGQGSAESYDNAKQIIFDKLIQKVNEAYNSKDLTKTKLFKFLESVHGADVKNLFVDLNIAKHKKYSSVLDALFSKFTGHDDEILADLGNIVDLLPDRLNLLVERMSYNEFKDGMVPMNMGISKKGTSNQVPYFCESVNSEDDIMVNNHLIHPNIYIDLESLSELDEDSEIKINSEYIEKFKKGIDSVIAKAKESDASPSYIKEIEKIGNKYLKNVNKSNHDKLANLFIDELDKIPIDITPGYKFFYNVREGEFFTFKDGEYSYAQNHEGLKTIQNVIKLTPDNLNRTITIETDKEIYIHDLKTKEFKLLNTKPETTVPNSLVKENFNNFADVLTAIDFPNKDIALNDFKQVFESNKNMTNEELLNSINGIITRYGLQLEASLNDGIINISKISTIEGKTTPISFGINADKYMHNPTTDKDVKVFDAEVDENGLGTYTITSLKRIKSLDGLDASVQLSGSAIEDAVDYRIVEKGVIKKNDQGVFEIVKPLKIELFSDKESKNTAPITQEEPPVIKEEVRSVKESKSYIEQRTDFLSDIKSQIVSVLENIPESEDKAIISETLANIIQSIDDGSSTLLSKSKDLSNYMFNPKFIKSLGKMDDSVKAIIMNDILNTLSDNQLIKC